MLRRTLTLLMLAVTAPALAEAPVPGTWICEYGVRKLSSSEQSSSAWFEITLVESGKFHGTGKARAAGSTVPMILRGAWAMDEDGILKLTGVSDVTNRIVPFRFISDRKGDDQFKRREMKAGAEYKTSCRRK